MRQGKQLMKQKHEEGDRGSWSMSIAHLLSVQRTHERGQNPKRETEREDRESKQAAGSTSASVKLQALSPRWDARRL